MPVPTILVVSDRGQLGDVEYQLSVSWLFEGVGNPPQVIRRESAGKFRGCDQDGGYRKVAPANQRDT